MLKLIMLVFAALFALAMAAPSPVASPDPAPNPQFFYSSYPVAYASPYVYYG